MRAAAGGRLRALVSSVALMRMHQESPVDLSGWSGQPQDLLKAPGVRPCWRPCLRPGGSWSP